MKNRVFVLDRRGHPLMPCTAKKARLLLSKGRARVHRYVPFTIRIVDRLLEDSALQPVQIKLDPGSKATGIAVVRGEYSDFTAIHGLYLMELEHRGQRISLQLQQRSMYRRNRRSRKTRYRKARFSNRTKPKGWLAPSLVHRIQSTMSWVRRFQKLVPVTALAQELVRFDTQQLENPDISGIEYQQGTLAGYEVREYLLEKYNRCCVYCGKSAMDVTVQIDHVVPRAHGGSNRVSNLVLACWKCNATKGSQPVEIFLVKKPEVLRQILASLKRPLKDAAAVNATRWRLYESLRATGLPVSVGTGGRTKWNRSRFGIPKTHAHDALCVGAVESVSEWRNQPTTVKCTARGRYQRTVTDRYGFPRAYLMRRKFAFGFKTGDLTLLKMRVREHNTQQLERNILGMISIRQRGQFLFVPTRKKLAPVNVTHSKLRKVF